MRRSSGARLGESNVGGETGAGASRRAGPASGARSGEARSGKGPEGARGAGVAIGLRWGAAGARGGGTSAAAGQWPGPTVFNPKARSLRNQIRNRLRVADSIILIGVCYGGCSRGTTRKFVPVGIPANAY